MKFTSILRYDWKPSVLPEMLDGSISISWTFDKTVTAVAIKDNRFLKLVNG